MQASQAVLASLMYRLTRIVRLVSRESFASRITVSLPRIAAMRTSLMLGLH